MRISVHKQKESVRIGTSDNPLTAIR